MDLIEITQEIQVQQISQQSDNQIVLIFKTSPYCGNSAIKNNQINNFTFSTPIIGYRVNVIDAKPLSMKIAQTWNVLHMSPQIILIKNNKVIYHCSHNQIIFPIINTFIENFK